MVPIIICHPLVFIVPLLETVPVTVVATVEADVILSVQYKYLMLHFSKGWEWGAQPLEPYFFSL